MKHKLKHTLYIYIYIYESLCFSPTKFQLEHVWLSQSATRCHNFIITWIQLWKHCMLWKYQSCATTSDGPTFNKCLSFYWGISCIFLCICHIDHKVRMTKQMYSIFMCKNITQRNETQTHRAHITERRWGFLLSQLQNSVQFRCRPPLSSGIKSVSQRWQQQKRCKNTPVQTGYTEGIFKSPDICLTGIIFWFANMIPEESFAPSVIENRWGLLCFTPTVRLVVL